MCQHEGLSSYPYGTAVYLIRAPFRWSAERDGLWRRPLSAKKFPRRQPELANSKGQGVPTLPPTPHPPLLSKRPPPTD